MPVHLALLPAWTRDQGIAGFDRDGALGQKQSPCSTFHKAFDRARARGSFNRSGRLPFQAGSGTIKMCLMGEEKDDRSSGDLG